MKEHAEVPPVKVCLRRKEHFEALPLGHSSQNMTDTKILDLPLVVRKHVVLKHVNKFVVVRKG